jgi:group II intron reverse transcriptase/maturase
MQTVNGDKFPDLYAKLNQAAKADPARRFYTLWDKLCRSDVLWRAWRNVKRNRGAAGIDKVTIKEVENGEGGVEAFLNGIADEIRADTFRVKDVRRVQIPKPSGGVRTLGIPTVKDRVVQAAVKLVIEPIFEADFRDCSYGFRPGRSQHQAVREVYTWLNFGCVNVLDADIEAFFDSIPHDKLMALVERRVSDIRILRMIRAWLHHGAMKDGRDGEEEAGTPQGGVISPLLANIYLNELDKAWEERGLAARAGCDAKLVRYADDFVVLTSKGLDGPVKVVEEVLAGLGLKLSAKKTRPVRVENGEGFDFLGFHFLRRFDRKRGKTVTYFAPAHKNIVRIRRKVSEATDRKLMGVKSVREVVTDVNRKLRGWRNYFHVSDASGAFRRVQRHAERRLIIFIQRRRNRRGLALRKHGPDFLYGVLGLYRMGGIEYLTS